MKPRAIHQFHNGCAYGDGITNGMFFTQRILQAAGYASEIFCFNIDPVLSSRVRPASTYEGREDELLLVHYSLGTAHDAWISNIKTPSVLVYHNITPAEFFPEGSELRAFVVQGRKQLAQWAQTGKFVGCIADSQFNADELAGWRYRSIAAIGLLVDLDRLRAHPWEPVLAKDPLKGRTVLFVGRICEHKGQVDLVRALSYLCASVETPVQLALAGDTTTEDYQRVLHAEIARLNMQPHVRLLGKRTDAEIYGLYREADVYVSLSEHEGFGMPLVEAMALELPVIAFGAGSVPATLGTGGLILNTRDPKTCAATIKTVMEEPSLRQGLLQGQRQAVARFERNVLIEALETHLCELGFEVTLRNSASAPARQKTIAIEGPFDSSYSLATVNRELARALERAGEDVCLVSRDNDSPFAANVQFLAENPDIAAMDLRARQGTPRAIGLRNQFPPYVQDISGSVRGLCNFAWEESGLPASWVAEFNTRLDLCLVTSSYVAKVLRDNGVRIPIGIVGNGVDHFSRGLEQKSQKKSTQDFCFLHISSCFPRKAVDVLLKAWQLAFTHADPVRLVIKTFPNPYNDVETQLADFRRQHPDLAKIELINEDVSQTNVEALYRDADAFVAASRGEGFGLPLAEGLLLGLPVITTGFGGQSDFCRQDTAWLCDFSFAYARSHLSVQGSVWVEPDVQSLAAALKACHDASVKGREDRAGRGQDLVARRYRWDAVARRTLKALQTISEQPVKVALPCVGLVSSWNTRCGIAAYAASQIAELHHDRVEVFASRTNDLLEPDRENVLRCWDQGHADPLDELAKAIIDKKIEALIIQFNFGFFKLSALEHLIDKMSDAGIQTYIVLHSTADVVRPDLNLSLKSIAPALSRVRRLFVHSIHDLNRLKSFGLVDNVTLIPMGVPPPPAQPREEVRASLGFRPRTRVLASFGYLLPHKGLRELVQAFDLMRRSDPDLRLLMLNSLYPAATSQSEQASLMEDIEKLGLRNHITLRTEYLDEADAVRQLSAADLVVFPYQHTQESASAAVKMALSACIPVACTPLSIFDDVAEITHALPGIAPAQIAEGCLNILRQSAELDRVRHLHKTWVHARQWPVISKRIDNIVRGEFNQPHPLNGLLSIP